jgi:tetratricopeptide (TPR) repeat protein
VRPALTPLATSALSAVVLIALLGGWWALRPVRADVATARGDQARVDQQLDAAVADYRRATELLPGASRYWARLAAQYNLMGQIEPALDAYRQATDHDPYDSDAWRNTGRLADAARRFDLAHTSFARAVRLDPHNGSTVLDLATFDLRHGRAQEAREVLETALRVVPTDPTLLASLGDAQAVLGDVTAALRSYREALRLDPAQATATSGLAKLKQRA